MAEVFYPAGRSYKFDFTLAEIFSPHPTSQRRTAFTLAEVLITLGIIGVVAAMTMPTLIANHQKKQTVVRLKKFYSIMSQALVRYMNESDDFSIPEDAIGKADESLTWFNDTIGKYLVITNQEIESERNFKIAFSDGSGMSAYTSSSTGINIFYCTEWKYCKNESFDGNRTFLFQINKGRLYASSSSYSQMTRQQLLDRCKYGNSDPGLSMATRRHTCTKLIEYDGWNIAPDYPWKHVLLPENE